MRHLDVYMDGEFAGEVVQADTGKTTFTYDRNYSEPRTATPLSLSMPIDRQTHPQRAVLPFLKGLLSDSEGRLKQIGQEYGVSHNNPVALLEHVGSDAAGAIQLLPHGVESADAAERTGDVTVLSDDDFSELIRDLIKNKDTWGTRPRHGKWSLPGAQPKVALFQTENGDWAIPNDSTPTTHILKPSIEPYSDHHFNEFMSMSAARHLGLNVAEDDMLKTSSGDAVFVSQRYDRKLVNNRWVRLHQEDLGQALSIDPSNKYQSDGGPGVKEIAKLFQQLPMRGDSVDASTHFFDALCFNVAMQGTDAHIKNYSIMLTGQSVTLSPLYDLGSHAPYKMPEGETMKLAMSIDGEYRVNGIGVKHLTRTGVSLGLREGEARERAIHILSSTPEAFSQAAKEAGSRLGTDPFIAVMVDSIADYAESKGWVERTTTVPLSGSGVASKENF